MNNYYKVVTTDLKSLGLRNNPTILSYPINKWVYEKNKLLFNKSDNGGIWVTNSYSNAKGLSRYMLKKHKKQTRIFKCDIDGILYSNSYRTKVASVKLLYEIKG